MMFLPLSADRLVQDCNKSGIRGVVERKTRRVWEKGARVKILRWSDDVFY